MLRINQFAKDLGVTNHDVIEALEKRLGISGKSHSSNLTDDQISQLRRVFDAKSKGMEDGTPLALHKPSVPVRIVKAAAPVEPAGQVPPPAPVLVKGPEPAEEAARPAPEASREAAPRPPVPSEQPKAVPAPAGSRAFEAGRRSRPRPGGPGGFPPGPREDRAEAARPEQERVLPPPGFGHACPDSQAAGTCPLHPASPAGSLQGASGSRRQARGAAPRPGPAERPASRPAPAECPAFRTAPA